MESNVKTTRSSNFELLRILSMLMIVMHHYALFSGFVWDVGEITTNRLIINFFSMFGRMGNSIFIMISRILL